MPEKFMVKTSTTLALLHSSFFHDFLIEHSHALAEQHGARLIGNQWTERIDSSYRYTKGGHLVGCPISVADIIYVTVIWQAERVHHG